MATQTSSTERARSAAAGPLALVVGLTWTIIVVSCVRQKRRADDLIGRSVDISAVQIQQLNGSVTSHALVAITIGLAVTAVAAFVVAASGSRSAAAAFEVLDELRRGDRGGAGGGEPTRRTPTAPRVRPLIIPPRAPRSTPSAAPDPSPAPPPPPPPLLASPPPPPPAGEA